MRHALTIVAVSLSMLGADRQSGGPREFAPLSVRIVPTHHREGAGRVIELGRSSPHFRVVVTNVSDQTVRLWREWCSWGYFNLSFVATGEDGKSVVVKKKPRGWDKNDPDATILLPGDHMVFEVSFDEASWENAPTPESVRPRVVRLKAEYAIGPDDAAKHKVWSGRATSPEEVYTLYQ